MNTIKVTLIVSVVLFFATGRCSGQRPISFNRDIRPILSDRCFHCHGPNEHDRQADLRLDIADPESQAIEPGSIDDSELWHRINSSDDDIMPPPDSAKSPLTEKERETIRQWIEDGAAYEDVWAYSPPLKRKAPTTQNSLWNQQPIDQFVMNRLESEGLSPSPMADRRSLIRRVTLDLTGLPPTRKEIRQFLNDSSNTAYERLVDRLLAKREYGEHMTKYWLDLVRFADTNGIHHDHYRDMTPYRDWVIRSFNENLPYDDFVKFQLAGDLYPAPTRDQLIATGFNRLHLIIDVGTALPEESLSRNVIDRVTAVGTAFLGMTVQCAVCHDHKYDPITTKEFYSLSAFFNNLDAQPETGGRQGTDFKRGLQQPYISLANGNQRAAMDKFDIQLAELNKNLGKLNERLKATESETNKNELTKEINTLKQDIKNRQLEREKYEDGISFAMVMKERLKPRPTHVMIRGEYDNPGDRVERDTPAFLPEMSPAGTLKTRMDLANWFVAPNHPLTARVAVNRFWQQLFGVGIVKTSEDFGAQGEWPSHPEVLDFLAATYVESGWDTKALIKQLVMSQTYQQSSETTPENIKKDPENRLLARGSRFRMDSEMIRDQILATSGLLNSELYGKSVKPPQPNGLWKSVNMPSSYPRIYQQDAGNKIYRRSVYTFWKRSMPPPQMTILNAPNRESCIARRERTNTPLQALLLLNEPEFLKASMHLAQKTISDRSMTSEQYLSIVYETITSNLPDANESENLLKLIRDLETLYRNNEDLANQLCPKNDVPPGVSQSELAAWTILISTLYNFDITKTRG